MMALASEKDGVVSVNLVCTDYDTPCQVELDLGTPAEILSGETLSSRSLTDCNPPDDPFRVIPRENLPQKRTDGRFSVILPAGSVSVLRFKTK